MSVHLRRAIEQLKEQTLALSATVEEAVWLAVRAVQEHDTALARSVIAGDRDVDEREVRIEEECLKILALHQPVAGDLRFLVTVLKITNDLERIGDLAVNIAERAIHLANREEAPTTFDFVGMATRTQEMLHTALDALVNTDPLRARDVCAMDDEVDAANRGMYGQVQAGIREHPRHTDFYLQQLSISRHLERIADHATNIAEDVIYMSEGRVVRHHVEEFRVPGSGAAPGTPAAG
ncbi:MAG: phosphate signaling complex protein PhoU [Candidatus Latescibacteria bacterium]|nr:phosphate signaling complex protein PhoU [Candidatus Latescibacterota bacterium]